MANQLNRTIQNEALASSPTGQQWGAYVLAFTYFNNALWGGQLPTPILNLSRKGARTLGFFAPERWERSSDETTTHEISLNPTTMKGRDPKDVMSTLVHEMAHLWQQEFGKPSRRGYHNKEWGTEMDRIGLPPSNTGAPGGKRTGQQMSHYIEAGGAFDRAFEAMPKEYLLPWVCDDFTTKKEPKRTRNKFVCDGCGAQVWGKPGLHVACVDCEQEMQEEGAQ